MKFRIYPVHLICVGLECAFISCFMPAHAAELTLANKAPFANEVDPSLPRETLFISFAGGASLLPKEKQGLTTILTDLFDEGPQGTSPDAFRKKLFLMNASVGLSSDTRAMHLGITAPKETLSEALALGAETLHALKLFGTEFERSKAKVFAGRQAASDDMAHVIRYFTLRDYFNYQPDTMSGEGSVKTIKGLKLADLQKYVPELLNKSHAFFTAIGPVQTDVVKKDIEKYFLKDSAKFTFTPVKFTETKMIEKKSSLRPVTLINKKGATDNQIMLVYPLYIKHDGPDALDATVAHEILGGGLSSRLGKTLRVERGLTYHVSSFAGSKLPVWGVYTFGGLFQTPDLLKGVDEVLTKFKNESVPESDIAQAVDGAKTRYLEATELPSDRLFEKIKYRLYGLDISFFENYLTNVDAVNASRVHEFQQNKMLTEQGHLYVMGDAKKILPMLKKLGNEEKNIRVIEQADME